MKRIKVLLSVSVALMYLLCGCEQYSVDTTQQHTIEDITTEEDIQENIQDDKMIATTEDMTDESTEEVTDAATEQKDDESYGIHTNMYYEILDSTYQMICAGPEEYDYVDGTNGIGELIMSGDDNVLGC